MPKLCSYQYESSQFSWAFFQIENWDKQKIDKIYQYSVSNILQRKIQFTSHLKLEINNNVLQKTQVMCCLKIEKQIVFGHFLKKTRPDLICRKWLSRFFAESVFMSPGWEWARRINRTILLSKIFHTQIFNRCLIHFINHDWVDLGWILLEENTHGLNSSTM